MEELTYEDCTTALYSQTTGDVSNCTWVPNVTTWSYSYAEDKTAKALRIIKLLMDKKLIKVTTVKQFVDLLDKVSSIL